MRAFCYLLFHLSSTDDLKEKSSIEFSVVNMTLEEFLLRARTMIELFLSIFTLIACVSIAYLLITIDNIVNQVLYQFGLQFSYEWATPYWMFLRASLALLGLIAVVASMNITYTFRGRQRKPVLVKTVKTTKAEIPPPTPAPSLFQCTSCGRSITEPLRIHVILCPFCNATVVPASYVQMGAQLSELQLDKIKTVVKDYLKAGILTLDDLK